jgi:hypothetical protein
VQKHGATALEYEIIEPFHTFVRYIARCDRNAAARALEIADGGENCATEEICPSVLRRGRGHSERSTIAV